MKNLISILFFFSVISSHNLSAQCNGKPLGGAARTPNNICLNDSVTLTLEDASTGTGITYQWQYSPDDQKSTYSDISGATGLTYRVLTTTTYKYFRVVVTCTNGSNVWRDTSSSCQVVYINILPWNEHFSNVLITGKDRVWNCWRNYCTLGEMWLNAGRAGIGHQFQGGPKPPYPINQNHNNLLVTPAFELIGGVTYKFSFFHKEDGANICWDSLYVVWGTNNAKDSMNKKFGRTLLKFSYDEFVRYAADFKAPYSGIFYFGVVVKDQDVNKGDMIFDDFQLKPIEDCGNVTDIKKGAMQTGASPKRVIPGKKDKEGIQLYCIGDTVLITYEDQFFEDWATPNFPNPGANAPYQDYANMSYQIQVWYKDVDFKVTIYDHKNVFVKRIDHINPPTDTIWKTGKTSTNYKQFVGGKNSILNVDTIFGLKDSMGTIYSIGNKFANLPADGLCHITNMTDYHAVNVLATDTDTYYKVVATCLTNGKEFHSDSILINGTKSLPWCTNWKSVNINPMDKTMKKKNGGTFNSHQNCPKCWVALPDAGGNWTGVIGPLTPLSANPTLAEMTATQFRKGTQVVFHYKGNVRRHLVVPPARLYNGRGYRFSFYWADNNNLQFFRSKTDSMYVALARGQNVFISDDKATGNTTYNQNAFKQIGPARLNFSSNIYEAAGTQKYQQFWYDYMPPDTATYYFAVYTYGAPGSGALLAFDGFCIDTLTVAAETCPDTPHAERIRISPDNKYVPFQTPGDHWCSGTHITVQMKDIDDDFDLFAWKFGNKIMWQYQIVGTSTWVDMPADTTNTMEYTLTNQHIIFRAKITNNCGISNYSDTVDVQAPGSVLPWREEFENEYDQPLSATRCWYGFPEDNWGVRTLPGTYGAKSKCNGNNYLYTQRNKIANGSGTSNQLSAVAPGFYLTKDSFYRFSFWYKDNGESTPWDNLSGIWGLATNNVNNLMSPAVNNFSNKKFTYYTALFKADTSLDHYFGVRVNESGTFTKKQIFDNFEFKKQYKNDLVVVSLDSPFTKCGMNSAMTISMSVMNLGTDTQSNFNIGYSINGGASVNNTYNGSIAPGQIKQVSFSTTANMSTPGMYDFRVWTALSNDQDKWDDTLIICNEIEHKLDPPVPSSLNDTFCLNNNIVVNGSTPVVGDQTYWFRNDTAKLPFYVGDYLGISNIQRDTMFWVQSSTRYSDRTTPYYNTLGTQAASAAFNGLFFDVYSDKCDSILLETVDMYATAPGAIAQIILRKSDLTVMPQYTRNVILNDIGLNVVRLDWVLPPGTDYSIMLNSTSVAMSTNTSGAQYPYVPVTHQFVKITAPTSPSPAPPQAPKNYHYFYNWLVTCRGCESAKVPLKVNTKASPTINLGRDTIVCTYPPHILDAGSGHTTYQWNNASASTTQKIVASTSKRYVVTVTNSLGCASIDSVDVTVNNSPPVKMTDTIGCEGTTVEVEALNLDTLTKYGLQKSQFIYAWNVGSSDRVIGVTKTGDYEVTAYDIINFCHIIDTVQVTIHKNPVVNLGNDGIFCGIPYVLDATPTVPSIYTYKWDNNLATPNRSINVDGNYSVIVKDQLTKCSGYDTVAVTLAPKPPVNLGNDTNVCGLTNKLSLPVGPYNYLWQTTQVSRSITVTSDGLTWGEAQDTVTGCVARDTIQTNFLKLPYFELGSDIVQCGGSVNLTLPSSILGTGVGVLWSTPTGVSSNQSITASTSGTYKALVNNNNCYSYNDSIKIRIEKPAVADSLPSDVASCGNIQLTATSDPSNLDITWTGEKKGNNLVVNKSGSYSVALKNSCGVVNKTTQVRIDSIAKANFTINYPGTPMTIGLIDKSEGAYEYDWDFGDNSNNSSLTNPTHTYTREGVFGVTLTVKNACGTKSITKYTVKIVQPSNGIKDLIVNSGVKLYPNPTTSMVTLEVNGLKEGSYRLEMRDMTGKRLIEEQLSTTGGSIKKQLDITQFAAGKYQMVLIDAQNKLIFRSLIVE